MRGILINSRLYAVMLVLGILALSTVACAIPKPSETSGLENSTWILESYGKQGNMQKALQGTEITAIFDSTEGEVRGSAGCNTYFADYKIKNSKLSILQLAYTEMYCLEPEGVMEQEKQYLKALQAAESFQVQDGKLQINSGNEILIYNAK